jgi:hypothetical protein
MIKSPNTMKERLDPIKEAPIGLAEDISTQTD